MKTRSLYIVSLILSFIFIYSCGNKNNKVLTTPGGVTIEYKTPKYVFFFIGDGMTTPQIRIAEAALAEKSFIEQHKKQTNNNITKKHLSFSNFPGFGMSTTNAENRYITGSAAAGTALATGNKTFIGRISVNSDNTKNYRSMAEMAKDKGLKVGIVTSVSIDHATPACFYAHTDSRSNYEEIGKQLVKTNFDYFGGGFILHERYENKSPDQFLQAAKENGYTYVNTKDKLEALNKDSGKIIATIKKLETLTGVGSSLPYNIDLDTQPSDDDRMTLADFTRKGIELLDNEKGFFMMVESGKIDWTGHANDAVSNVYETIAFDDAIEEAIKFYNQHPNETLIVITGDHECGGLTLGFAGTQYETSFGLLSKQTVSYEEFSAKVNQWKESKGVSFEHVLNTLKEDFGLSGEGLTLSEYETQRLKDAFNNSLGTSKTLSNEERKLYYGGYEPISVTATHILNNKAGLDWTSFSHTALPAAVYAIGQGHELFNGFYDNTDIAKKIMEIADFK